MSDLQRLLEASAKLAKLPRSVRTKAFALAGSKIARGHAPRVAARLAEIEVLGGALKGSAEHPARTGEEHHVHRR